MKLLVFLLTHVALIASQKAAEVLPAAETVIQPIVEESQRIPESSWCIIGTIAVPPPPPPYACFTPNEIYACAFGEARCDGLGFCGTPPCHWRCWCKNGYKRTSSGACVKICKGIANPFPIELYEKL